jgi:hypothetical protein
MQMLLCSYTSSGSQLSIREPVRTLSADSPAYERSEAICEVFVTVVGKYLIPAELPLSVPAVVCYDSRGSTSLVCKA